MTANQINYQKYLEDVRTHKANEQIGRRQATAAERQASTAESNAVANLMNAQTNRENLYVNQSAVGAQWYGAQANAAYQQAMAEVSRQQALEAIRHNQAQEANTLLVEGEKRKQEKYAADLQADTSIRNMDVQMRERIVEALAGDVTQLIIAAPKLVESIVGANGLLKSFTGG